MGRRIGALKALKKFENSPFPYKVSLEDFITFVTGSVGEKGLLNDEHWMMQESLCNLCSYRYGHTRLKGQGVCVIETEGGGAGVRIPL